MAKPSPSTFASTIIPTTEDLYLRDLRRQFVSISPQPGSAQPLPRSMRKLEELFQALEHTILFDSKDASMGVIYHRIRKSVEVMAKRTFGWHELGQILAVYPESYTFGALPTMHEGRRVVSVELKPRAHGLQMAVEMERRRVEFRKRLVRIVEAEHGGFWPGVGTRRRILARCEDGIRSLISRLPRWSPPLRCRRRHCPWATSRLARWWPRSTATASSIY
ncbi:hypothetical protein BX661DRAFT_52446 [Kickxella alabastrina]|uniref:uncharacterized protein n=1 Tax=Kickxella alabastrina TaxID=61397 RepID=UPI00221F0514|nr:uncharacterized protein BX661DRAFT_52446 [Kickxella alabastrina]KAI7834385.1 hypothetical protein BX661DRAFT_52446 [Kickxella alabastrina]